MEGFTPNVKKKNYNLCLNAEHWVSTSGLLFLPLFIINQKTDFVAIQKKYDTEFLE